MTPARHWSRAGVASDHAGFRRANIDFVASFDAVAVERREGEAAVAGESELMHRLLRRIEDRDLGDRPRIVEADLVADLVDRDQALVAGDIAAGILAVEGGWGHDDF